MSEQMTFEQIKAAYLEIKAEYEAADERLQRYWQENPERAGMVEDEAYQAWSKLLSACSDAHQAYLDALEARLGEMQQRLNAMDEVMAVVKVEARPLNLWSLPLVALDRYGDTHEVLINPASIASIEPEKWGDSICINMVNNRSFWVAPDALAMYLDHGVADARAPKLLIDLPDDDDDVPPAAFAEMPF